MEVKVNRPALAGRNIDPDTFQRVWDRVMPGQAAPRQSSTPSTAPGTSVPAEPSIPPEEVLPQPPAEETPPTTPDLPPVPECPAGTTPDQPDQPNQPDQPSVPECPAQPECPECPACPECPSVPGTPPVSPSPESPILCLGEASQGDSTRLEELMTLARIGAAAGSCITRRASGACARTLAALTRDHRTAFRRLSTAYFLITGKRYAPQCAPIPLPASLPLALRQQFLWEQQWELKNNQAAQATADPCLKELYLELAQEGAFHAGCIRSLLEQM